MSTSKKQSMKTSGIFMPASMARSISSIGVVMTQSALRGGA